MTIDANLIEGLKLGFGAGIFLGGPLAFALGWYAGFKVANK